MFRHNIFIMLLFGSLCAGVTTAGAEVIFSDSFESGDMSATNVDGFTWGKNNRTAIVTQDPIDGSVRIWDNGKVYETLSNLMPDGSTRAYTAKDGKNSLRFRYAAGAEWTEQRFDFGKGYPEIWFSYHIRVPLNYVRGTGTVGKGHNNKWMIFLMGSFKYYSNSTTSWVEVKDYPNAAKTGIDISLQIHNGVDNSYTSSGANAYKDFVTPADAGRWMEIIFHLKASSDNSTADGSVIMYRKWADEKRFEYVTGYTNRKIGIGAGSVASNYIGWGVGYFMGWANDPYPKETDWLIDDVVISTTPLLPNPPLPPSKVGAKKVILK